MAARFAGMLRQEEHDAVAEKRPVLTAFAAFFGDFRTPSASETLHECRMAALERAGPETRWTERPPDARMGMKRNRMGSYFSLKGEPHEKQHPLGHRFGRHPRRIGWLQARKYAGHTTNRPLGIRRPG
jgi:hypothetical protein